MPKKLICLLLILLPTISLLAADLDVQEITSTRKVRFINNQPANHNSSSKYFHQTIKSIGKHLANQVSTEKQTGTYYNKYSIIHINSTEEIDKYAADIISINKTAKIDHINNIRRIIAGYLENMYGYTPEDARTIAIYITYYNAVYRQNYNYFQKKYKTAVIKNVTPKNVGLAIRYTQWPGKTKIIIPLTEKAQKGNISAIDFRSLNEPRVQKQIDQKPVKEKMLAIREDALEERKEILAQEKEATKKKELALKIKKLKAEKQKAEKSRKTSTLEKEQKNKKNQRSQKTKNLNTTQKQKTNDKQKITSNKENEQEKSSPSLEKTEKELALAEQEIAIEKEKQKIEEESIKSEEQTLTKENPEESKEKELGSTTATSKKLAEKEATLKEKEKQLNSREEQLRKEKVDEKIFGLNLYYLKIKQYLTGGHYYNEMYKIDPATSKVILVSPVKNISGKKYDMYSDGVCVITFQKNESSDHHLTLLDPETLEKRKEGKVNIFWRSFVKIRDKHIFAVIKEGNKYYLGKFNGNLDLVAKSTKQVDPDTFISFYVNYIYINDYNKEIIVLNNDSLEYIGTVSN